MKISSFEGISVIICCFNSESRIEKTLLHLASQTFKGAWEVVLVDNNCTDQTTRVARETWTKSGNAQTLKITKEPHPGLTYARAKGVMEADFDNLIFCDDDNWLQSDFLERAYALLKSKQEIAVFGSHNLAAFEDEPPDWFGRYQQHYAVGKQFERSADITEERGFVWGAGMVIRKEALMDLMSEGKFTLRNKDRTGKKLSDGGDTEICFALRQLGYRIYYAEELVLTHFMPAGRLKWSILRKMFFAAGMSSVVYDFYRSLRRNLLFQFSMSISELWKFRRLSLTYRRLHEREHDILILEHKLGRLYNLIRMNFAYIK